MRVKNVPIGEQAIDIKENVFSFCRCPTSTVVDFVGVVGVDPASF